MPSSKGKGAEGQVLGVREDGAHGGHKVTAHRHVAGSVFCSGRFFCQSCRPQPYPGTWFAGQPCAGMRLPPASW
jgi:hypothetical protein